MTAAKAMWQRDPQSVAVATLGCDFAEAANPYGCNGFQHKCPQKGTTKENRQKNVNSTPKICGIDATQGEKEKALKDGIA